MNDLLKLYSRQEVYTEYLEWFDINKIQIKNKIKELYAQNTHLIDEELNKIATEIYNEEKLNLISQLNSIKIEIERMEKLRKRK